MQANPVSRFLEAVRSAGGDLLVYGIFALIVILLLVIVWKIISGRRRELPKPALDLRIDVMSLGTHGPPADAPALEFFNVPVRLAAVVLAPAGRVRELPPINQWDDLYEAIVPGLAKVVAAHKPLVRRWPAQLSVKGFAHTFFQHVRLPGEGGKGTPWSSAAGVLRIEGQPVMAGLVFRTQSPSGLGQQIIDTQEKWLGILRVKE